MPTLISSLLSKRGRFVLSRSHYVLYSTRVGPIDESRRTYPRRLRPSSPVENRESYPGPGLRGLSARRPVSDRGGGGSGGEGDRKGSDGRRYTPRDGGSNHRNRSDSFRGDRGERRYPERLSKDKIQGEYDGDHIYGITPIRAALLNKRRRFDKLFVQEGMDLSSTSKKNSVKGGQALQVIRLAQSLNMDIKEISKHDLNMLSDSRPHQGFVLRGSPLSFNNVGSNGMEPTESVRVVLALDEVWDPQNFGALLRTCHFLKGIDEVIVCSKNSAPLSPVVSKASSGAMEVMDIKSTDNMMRFLDKSIANGWQVIGTSLKDSVDISEIPIDKPTILVLGNEGHGIRTNVLRKCTHIARIAGGEGDDIVDSLNVSVTGGILLHYIASKKL